MTAVPSKTLPLISDREIAAHVALAPVMLHEQATSGLSAYVGKRVVSWRVSVFWAGRNRTITIGSHPGMTATQARARAEDVRAGARNGVNPHSASSRASFTSLNGLISVWVAVRKTKAREQWANGLRRHFAPLLHRPAAHLTTQDLQACIDRLIIEKPGAAYEAGKRLKQCMSWAVQTELLNRSPAAMLYHGKQGIRSRTPSLRELRLLWWASEHWPDPVKILMRCAMLTGSRVAETAQMKFSDISEEQMTWSVPADDTKTGQGVDFAVSRQFLDVIAEARAKRWGDSVCGPRRGPSLLSSLRYRMKRVEGIAEPKISPHDFRRAMVQHASAFAPKEVLDVQLNHLGSASFSMVDRSYFSTRYVAERKAMIQQYADLIFDEESEAGMRQIVDFRSAKSGAK